MVRINDINSQSPLNSLLKLNQSYLNNLSQLSSGLRISRAANDAAGLSIANRLNTQFRALSDVYDTTQTGINLANVADSSLSNVSDQLQQIRGLLVQAGNSGALDSQSLQSIQDAINQNVDEIGRIANTTQFGSNYLLNGNYGSTADIRSGTSSLGVSVDQSRLSTQENFFTIRRVQDGSAQITTGNDTGVQTINAGIVNQQDVAVTQGTFNTGTGTAVAADNLTNLTFNGASLQAGGTISFRGVLADGVTPFSGSFQLSTASDLAGGNGASTSLADAIQSAIDQAETGTGINTTGGTNVGETNVAYNATTGRLEFHNGAEAGVSDFNLNFSTQDAAGKLQNTTAITRAAEVGGVATGAQTGNSVTAITGNTFDTGQLNLQITNVTEAQARVVQSGISFQQAGGGAATSSTNLIGSVYNGVTLAQGDTITLNGTNADGSTFTNTITVSSVDGSAGNGAAVTLQDLVDELNVRDRTQPAGGSTGQSGFENATASLTSNGRIQLTDDVAGTSQSNFNLVVNDRSSGGGTFGTIADQGQVLQAGNAQQATVSVNGGPSQRVTSGQQVTLYGKSNGENAPQVTLRMGENLRNGSDTIHVTREQFTGSLNGGPEVRFGAGEQNVRFVSGLRSSESATLDFNAYVDVPEGEGNSGTVVISATSRQANFQLGANAGQRLGLNFGDVRPGSLGLGANQTLNDINIMKDGGIENGLAIVDQALNQVSRYREQTGAFSNRLESTANSLSVSAENYLASQSTIRDTDYAKASTQNAINQLLLQNNINVQSQINNLYNNIFANLLR